MRRRKAIRLLAAAAAAPAWAGSRADAQEAMTRADWSSLRTKVGDRLVSVRSPLADCAAAQGAGGKELLEGCKNPYFLGDDPALTQSLGWVDGWTSSSSTYAVIAEGASDVAAAVMFARENQIRLVVKGGGHSYFGNSNAPNSLLIWTRRMQAISHHSAFAASGAPPDESLQPAVSIGAGALWGQVYDAVSVQNGRYVQGGGCLTVGVAGFVLGGGFGSFSKQFGTGAANLLEAEIVTADGQIRTVNTYRHPDLFFALKGGGGGTFGIVTRLTLKTYPLPSMIGAVFYSLKATSEGAWRALVKRLLDFCADTLIHPTWGEQIHLRPGRRLEISILFQNVSEERARAAWTPFFDWVAARAGDFEAQSGPTFVSLPGRDFWNVSALERLPSVVLRDDRANAPPGNFYWASNRGEAGQVIHAYQSAWLPAQLLEPARRVPLADALCTGSATWALGLHLNKGLAGGSSEALRLTADTATSPDVLSAFALVICGAEGPPAWPNIPGHEPDIIQARQQAARVAHAMRPIRNLVPSAGAYVSETDFFDVGWKDKYWGKSYPRLLAIKTEYDPDGLFHGHHTVGS